MLREIRAGHATRVVYYAALLVVFSFLFFSKGFGYTIPITSTERRNNQIILFL